MFDRHCKDDQLGEDSPFPSQHWLSSEDSCANPSLPTQNGFSPLLLLYLGDRKQNSLVTSTVESEGSLSCRRTRPLSWHFVEPCFIYSVLMMKSALIVRKSFTAIALAPISGPSRASPSPSAFHGVQHLKFTEL